MIAVAEACASHMDSAVFYVGIAWAAAAAFAAWRFTGGRPYGGN